MKWRISPPFLFREVVCPTCGVSFTQDRSGRSGRPRKHCSDRCRRAHAQEGVKSRRSHPERCFICKAEYQTTGTSTHDRVCSEKCARELLLLVGGRPPRGHERRNPQISYLPISERLDLERAELADLEAKPPITGGSYVERRLRYLRLSIPDLEERLSRRVRDVRDLRSTDPRTEGVPIPAG